MPRSNFEAGQKSAVSENRSTEGYSPFIKQEDSPNLVEGKEKKKLESWTAVQQNPFKGKNKLKKKKSLPLTFSSLSATAKESLDC